MGFSLLMGALILAGIVLVLIAVPGTILLLIKLGVIAKEASRPVHQDQGTYTLDQGREVRSERE